MSENTKIKILYSAYKFYLHFFALYIMKHEISAEDWILHKKFESKLCGWIPEGYKS